MIYEYGCTNCDRRVERQLPMSADIPAAIQVDEGCSACGEKSHRRVYSVPHVPFKVRTGRSMTMREAGPPRDRHWKKRVMGEKYDGR